MLEVFRTLYSINASQRKSQNCCNTVQLNATRCNTVQLTELNATHTTHATHETQQNSPNYFYISEGTFVPRCDHSTPKIYKFLMNKLGRCDSYLRIWNCDPINDSLTHWQGTGVGARRCYRIKKDRFPQNKKLFYYWWTCLVWGVKAKDTFAKSVVNGQAQSQSQSQSQVTICQTLDPQLLTTIIPTPHPTPKIYPTICFHPFGWIRKVFGKSHNLGPEMLTSPIPPPPPPPPPPPHCSRDAWAQEPEDITHMRESPKHRPSPGHGCVKYKYKYQYEYKYKYRNKHKYRLITKNSIFLNTITNTKKKFEGVSQTLSESWS